MVKKFLFLAIGLLMLTGCSSNGNVNKKAYLKAVALDGNKLTLSFFSDEDGVITVTAKNPEEAKSIAELSVGKKIFTGHTELILLKNCNNLETLDYILHEWKVSPSCMVAQPEFNGRTILAQKKSEELTGSIKIAQEQDLAPECDIITILSGLLNDDKKVETAELSENGFCGVVDLK
ncbi:MAG: hypothetical protein K2H19_03960 [Ruminococcus sp.]|nr:hypothetical protein [Ruminococcus sp.]